MVLLTHDRPRRLAVLDAARSRRDRRQKSSIAAPDDGLLAALFSPRFSAILSAIFSAIFSPLSS